VSIAAAKSGIVMKTIQYQLRRKKCGAFALLEFSFSFILPDETFYYECITQTANPPLVLQDLAGGAAQERIFDTRVYESLKPFFSFRPNYH
jgi:hypothetical protein